jgi:hypothetical protein
MSPTRAGQLFTFHVTRPVPLLQLWDSEGDIRLYMLRAFQLHAPEVGSGITSLMTIERVPESRHIDSAPGTRKRLIPKFRVDGCGAASAGVHGWR